LQHRLVDMFVALEEARALSMAAAMAATAARADAARLAAAAWDCARRTGAKIAEEAIQMHGGIGMTEECRVGAYVKRILRNEASVA
jgi:alkylation response protein AidB-like acyl-CoA dehydrogenase